MSVAEFVAPVFLVAAGLLVVSGISKLLRPEPGRRALRSAGLPGGRGAVRLLGALEACVGAACLGLAGRVPALLLGATYAAFAGFLVRLRSKGAEGSCGCVGARDTPASLLHVGL